VIPQAGRASWRRQSSLIGLTTAVLLIVSGCTSTHSEGGRPTGRRIVLHATTAIVEAVPGGSAGPLGAMPGSIVWTPDGYRGVGQTNSQFVVWGSNDGLDWRMVHAEPLGCCGRSESSGVLHRFGNQLLDLNEGDTKLLTGATDLSASGFLRSSADNGNTWAVHTGGPFATPGLRVTGIDSAGGTVVVAGVINENSCTPRGSLWRSADLDNWNEVDLPGAPESGLRAIAAAPDGSLIATTTDHCINTQQWYRSTDGGASFNPATPPPTERPTPETAPPLPGHPNSRPSETATFVGRVGRQLLVQLDAAGFPGDGVSQTDPVLAATSDGISWRIVPRNTGLFGDGAVSINAFASAPTVGYSFADRTLRADDRYCFDDISTCHRRERILVRVDESLSATEANVTNDEYLDSLVAGDDGSLLMWHIAGGGPLQLRVARLAGPDPLPVGDEVPPLSPPSDPTPVLLGFSSVAVGQDFRARLMVSGCNGPPVLEVDGLFYVGANPPPAPYPTSWPVKDGWFFVRGQRPDAETFRFVIDERTTFDYKLDPNYVNTAMCA
jgi:hypothetical protein